MSLSADAVRRLEEKTRHTFRDLGRLERALTHASARPSAGPIMSASSFWAIVFSAW